MKPLTHNGKKYTNADSWRTAKATSSSKGGPQAGPMPGDEQNATHKASPVGSAVDDGQGEGQEQEQDGSAVAAEHGPANQVTISHEHEMGVHHVQSQHPDGHVHESMHESAARAHEHASKLAGAHEEESDADGDGDQGDDWDGDGE